MSGSKNDLVKYRIARAWDTFDDANILAANEKWNATINRLYYSSYYAVSAILLHTDLAAATHNGTKSLFTEHFIKDGVIDKDLGKIYSQLFTWRQKGDYDDLYDFDRNKVLPYFEPVRRLIETIENKINST